MTSPTTKPALASYTNSGAHGLSQPTRVRVARRRVWKRVDGAAQRPTPSQPSASRRDAAARSSPDRRRLVLALKFGVGCIEAWLRDRELLIARAVRLLAPSFSTLEKQPFLFGDAPTLADAALHGQSLMLEAANPALLERVSPLLAEHARRMRGYLERR